jgi:hypothetical protein
MGQLLINLRGTMEHFLSTLHTIAYQERENEKETAGQPLCKGCHEPINLITVAMMKIVAKKPNDTTNPTPESTASLRLL